MSSRIERWHPYTLQLRQPWQTHGGLTAERRGRLLECVAGQGIVGWGDSAPLPEFGISELLADTFARETAAMDIEAQAAKLPLNALLSGSEPPRSLAVNANLGPLVSASPLQIAGRYASGFRVFKFKVGCAPINDELQALLTCCADLPPDARLRLDANGAWNPEEAARFIEACSQQPVDTLEEPLANPDNAMLTKLQKLANFPLSIDESVDLLNTEFFSAPSVQRLVLKPARFGSLRSTWKIGQNALAAGMEVVVTSALESACGLLACAHLAAALAPKAVHGLAVNDWLAGSPGCWPPIENGSLMLPLAPGLGFTPE